MIKNLFKNKRNKYNKGAVLFFAIMVSIILFIFTAGVLNIATKELNFSTSGKNSNIAFYAADSGIECALYNDMRTKDVFTEKGTMLPSCFNEEIKFDEGYPVFKFRVFNLGPDTQACAIVTVDKRFPPSTKIISKGYDIGGKDCNPLGLNSTERAIEVNYEE